jgi:hypothetical protein
MKIIYILIFLLFISCNTQNSNDKTTKKIIEVDSLKSKLLGHWGGLGEDNPVWEIKIDSIYYYQEKKTSPYQIVDMDMIIERPESKGILRNISVVEDTMTFYDEQGLTIKGYRFKAKK